MKKYKTQKGITLVALIITIVVLMILATVSINLIKNTDLIGKAEQATVTYQEKQNEENTILSSNEEFIKKYLIREITITYALNVYNVQYEIGMTWEEWCNSEYNTIGAYVNGTDIVPMRWWLEISSG